MKRNTAGIINGIIASTSYGTNPLFALPILASGVGINSILFYRYAIATVIYGVWLKFVKKIPLKINLKEFFILMCLGLLFSFSSLTLFEGFKYIEAGIACTILFIYPILVALIMTIFFKERLTKTVVFAIVLTFWGILLLYKGKPDSSLNIHGVSVVLLSALLYAIYIVGVKNIKTIKHMKADKLNFYVMVFGLLVYIYNLKFCSELELIDKPVLWLFACCLAIFPTIISLETLNIAIKLIGSTSTAVLGALEPLTAIFFGVIFFQEHLTLRIITGVVFILSGVFLIVLRHKHN